jgi:hypothetical protein
MYLPESLQRQKHSAFCRQLQLARASKKKRRLVLHVRHTLKISDQLPQLYGTITCCKPYGGFKENSEGRGGRQGMKPNAYGPCIEDNISRPYSELRKP